MGYYSELSGWVLKCNHRYPNKRKKKKSGVLAHRRRKRKQWDQTSKDGSYVSTGQGILAATRSRKRQGTGST